MRILSNLLEEAQCVPPPPSYPPRTINTIGQTTEYAESQKHGVYLHLLNKLNKSCDVVYHVQPVVMT